MGTCVGVDASGNTYVAGGYSSSNITFGTTTFTNTGGIDYFIAKYDPSGNVLWAKSATGVSNEGAYGLTIDATGNVYVVGTTNSSTLTIGSTALILHGYDDVFIVKYDASGNVLWAKIFGGTGNDIGESIGVDASGNSYMTGYYASATMAVGSTTLTNAGGNDMFITKYDASGNPVWAKSIGGSANESGNGIATDASGNSYITGYYASSSLTFGSTTLTNTGGLDFFTVKYDASGNALWAKSGTGASNEVGNGVKLDASGNIHVVGSYNSSSFTIGTTTLPLSGYDDIFTVKYDGSGNALWAKKAGGSNNDIGSAICVDSYGNSFITGYFSSSTIAFGSTTLTNNGSSGTNDIYVAAYDASGNPFWAKNAGGSNNDVGSAIALDVNGNSYVTGYFASSAITFTNTLNNSTGYNNMYVVKLGDNATGINEAHQQTDAFTVYPNPNNGSFNVQVKGALNNDTQVSVTNMLGQVIYEAKQDSQTLSLEIKGSGVYFVTIKTGLQASVKKVIVN